MSGNLEVLEKAGEAYRRGDLALAGRLLDAGLADHPADPDTLSALGSVRLAEDRLSDAKAYFERALAADPDHVDARLGLFDIASREQRFADALDQLMRLPESIRSAFDLLAHQADLLSKLGRYDEELALYDQLIAMRPDVPGLSVSKANALRIMGRRDEAIATLRQVTKAYPDYVRSWWLLSDLKDFRFEEGDIRAMSELLERTAAAADRVPLHFALAKAFEDRDEAKAAFEHYAAGNRLRAETFDREMLAIPAKVERVMRIFTADFLARRAGAGHDSDAPIFIVGLQRSGSTLIEQILASHPSIEGTAELPVLPQILQSIAEDAGAQRASALDRLAALDGDRLKSLGQLYLERAASYRRTDLPHFIDKLPGNWSNVGVIRLILPNARIIDARRHPMAVGFSNFKQNYGGGGYFTNSLTMIGRYYRDYLRLMSHFERIDPGAMHRVVNERLIEDTEGEIRSLLDYVGVPFDPACLDFHRNRRAVATPSAEQVRRPINRDGVDQWRAFEPWLGELAEALRPALEGWDLPPGSYRDEPAD